MPDLKRWIAALSLALIIPGLITTAVNAIPVVNPELRHHLAPAEIEKLGQLDQQGQVADGWAHLAELGDDYAAAAAHVLHPTSPEGAFSSNLVRWHWIHSSSESLYRERFLVVARQHFHQYLEILKTGFYPDSRQICESYRRAVTDSSLPPVTVFDGAWIAAGYQSLTRWEVLSRVPPVRWADSNIFQDLSPTTAKTLIDLDFTQALNHHLAPPADGEAATVKKVAPHFW